MGGLSWETKEGIITKYAHTPLKIVFFTDSLRKYFSQFGELSEASVKVKDSKHA